MNINIPNYEIISLIGKGGMGSVYLGKHIALKRQVAIKALLPELATDNHLRERFLNEARTLSILNHQNIVTLYDFAEIEKNLYLIMEYVQGDAVDNILKQQGCLNLQRTINIMKGVLSGFDYAHNKGIIHRDIKPANIILESNDNPKILDFGIARIIEGDVRLTKTGTRMGSVVYMSPEQILGRETDRRSDIYSLGVTFYEMLSGSLPYTTEGISDYEIQTMIINKPLPIIQSVNDNINRVIQKATTKDPLWRYQNCSEFLDELMGEIRNESQTNITNIESQKTVSIHNKETLQNTSLQTPKRNFNNIYFTGIAILLIIILMYVFLFKGQNENTNNVDIVNNKSQIENKSNDKSQIENKSPDNVYSQNKDYSLQIKELINSWVNRTNNKDINLSSMYADKVYFYNVGNISKNRLMKDKISFFNKWENVNISISDLNINNVNGKYICVYDKFFECRNSGGKSYNGKVRSNLMFENIDGILLITKEIDEFIYYTNKN